MKAKGAYDQTTSPLGLILMKKGLKMTKKGMLAHVTQGELTSPGKQRVRIESEMALTACPNSRENTAASIANFNSQ